LIETEVFEGSFILFRRCAPNKPAALTIDDANVNHLWKLSKEAVGLQ